MSEPNNKANYVSERFLKLKRQFAPILVE